MFQHIAPELRLILNKEPSEFAMFRILILISLWCSSFALAEPEDVAVAELRETISKIVDVQALESEERLEWQSRKQEIDALLELHQRELALLDEELQKSGQSAPAHEDATAEMKAEIEDLKTTRRLTAEAVARNVPRTIALAKRFPAPLLTELETELATLRSWEPAEEPREALRSILALLAKAEQFNRRFTRTTEIRDNREVQVLYLGLAQAFYADRNDKAGIGRPGPGGWTWKPLPEIRPELITAFETLDKKRPPTMVNLPLEIK